MPRPAELEGMESLGHGLYTDGAGVLHLDAAELLRSVGMPLDEEHFRMALEAAQKFAAELGVPFGVVEVDDGCGHA